MEAVQFLYSRLAKRPVQFLNTLGESVVQFLPLTKTKCNDGGESLCRFDTTLRQAAKLARLWESQNIALGVAEVPRERLWRKTPFHKPGETEKQVFF